MTVPVKGSIDALNEDSASDLLNACIELRACAGSLRSIAPSATPSARRVCGPLVALGACIELRACVSVCDTEDIAPTARGDPPAAAGETPLRVQRCQMRCIDSTGRPECLQGLPRTRSPRACVAADGCGEISLPRSRPFTRFGDGALPIGHRDCIRPP